MNGGMRMVTVVWGLIGFISLVGAGVLVLKREDNDFAKLLEANKDMSGRLTSIETMVKQYSDTQHSECQAIWTDVNAIRAAQAKIEKDVREPRVMEMTAKHAIPVSITYFRKTEQPTTQPQAQPQQKLPPIPPQQGFQRRPLPSTQSKGTH